ncbi:MAG: BolA family transcriptional regulator [Porticoccaceae bacterium]|nr:BolA family transcriptional regulator [Porticoccaceae bacterium]OUS02793.1 BolA family transcriptional regulator [Gammaproteobacteria bacterium 54_18_T64]
MSVEEVIVQKLRDALSPEHLQVDNVSHMHAVPADAETHFDIVVVAESFAGLRAVQCHQRVYQLLAEELSSGVHALSIHAFTPEYWALKGEVPAPPECLGGE